MKTNFDVCCENAETMAQMIDIMKCGWTREQILKWLKKPASSLPSSCLDIELGKKKCGYRYCEECKNFIALQNGVRGGKRGYCKRRNRSDVRSGRLRACKLFVSLEAEN